MTEKFNMNGFDIDPNVSLEEFSFEQVLTNIKPTELYEDYINNIYHPDENYIYSTLKEIGIDIFRWTREEEIRLIAKNSREFDRFAKPYDDDNYERTINACRAARTLWGRDGNVSSHPRELLSFARINHPDWFVNPVMAKIWELIILFHDVAEHLLMKNGRPAICDHKSNTKTDADKLWEKERIIQIVNSLPFFSAPLKNFIISVCNKEGTMGEKLGQLEHELFVFSSLKARDNVARIRDLGKLTFINTFNKIQSIRGETLEAILDYVTRIYTDCLDNEKTTRDSKFIQTLQDQRDMQINSNVIYSDKFRGLNR